jgi:hypothetical protein
VDTSSLTRDGGGPVTRVELGQIGWTDVDINRALEVAYRVVRLNGNRRGVRDRVVCVTDSLDVVHTYSVRKHKNDTTNLGCCYYTTWWDPEACVSVTAAIIYVNPVRDHGDGHVFTLTHEVAHALTQGSHGYTWRRMYALLLPLFCDIFDHSYVRSASGRMWVDLEASVHSVVSRYGVRYESSYARGNEYGNFISRREKIDDEVSKHVAASQRVWKQIGETL